MLTWLCGGSLRAVARIRRGRLRGVIVNEHLLSRSETRARVEWLARHFELIGHDELPRRIARSAGRPFCLLTFDDGKRANGTETAPELVRLGVPAVFYLTTGFVGGNRPLWFDRWSALARAVGRPPAGLELGLLKSLPLHLLEERLDRACAAHEIAVDLRDDRIGPLSWDDARALARQGFTIGAHGLRHTVMTRETEATALAEIGESLARITRELGAPCRSFAFPNGNYTARLARHAQACGAETVMTTEPLWVEAGAQRWRLPRVQLYPGTARGRVELKLALAATGRVLSNPDGTGGAYRAIARLAAANRGAYTPGRTP